MHPYSPPASPPGLSFFGSPEPRPRTPTPTPTPDAVPGPAHAEEPGQIRRYVSPVTPENQFSEENVPARRLPARRVRPPPRPQRHPSPGPPQVPPPVDNDPSSSLAAVMHHTTTILAEASLEDIDIERPSSSNSSYPDRWWVDPDGSGHPDGTDNQEGSDNPDATDNSEDIDNQDTTNNQDGTDNPEDNGELIGSADEECEPPPPNQYRPPRSQETDGSSSSVFSTQGSEEDIPPSQRPGFGMEQELDPIQDQAEDDFDYEDEDQDDEPVPTQIIPTTRPEWVSTPTGSLKGDPYAPITTLDQATQSDYPTPSPYHPMPEPRRREPAHLVDVVAPHIRSRLESRLSTNSSDLSPNEATPTPMETQPNPGCGESTQQQQQPQNLYCGLRLRNPLVADHVNDRYVEQGYLNAAGGVHDAQWCQERSVNIDNRQGTAHIPVHEQGMVIDDSREPHQSGSHKLGLGEKSVPLALHNLAAQLQQLHSLSIFQSKSHDVIQPSELGATVGVSPSTSSAGPAGLSGKVLCDTGGTELLGSHHPQMKSRETEYADGVPSHSITTPRKSPKDRKKAKGKGKAERKRTASSSSPIGVPQSERPSKRSRRTEAEPLNQQAVQVSTPLRVFAYWKANSSYYPGIVMSVSSLPNLYRVRFDDGTEADVDILHLRRCELHVGESICLRKGPREEGTVASTDLFTTHHTVTVMFKDGEEDVRREHLRLKDTWVDQSWDSRKMTAEQIMPLLPVQNVETVAGPSTRATAARAAGLNLDPRRLSGVGLLFSFSTTGFDDEKYKQEKMIKSQGGTVLSSWEDVFSFRPSPTVHDKNWHCRRDGVSVLPCALDKLILVADKESRKPNYLFAIACGIPCLSLDFLENFMINGFDYWQQYLLSAGTCTTLNRPFTQHICIDWPYISNDVANYLGNRVRSTMFGGRKVLFVGTAFVPGKKMAPDRTAKSFMPKIALAMGSAEVEAASNLKHARRPQAQYDFIVFEEGVRHPTVPNGVSTIDISCIRNYLISGIQS